MLVVERLRPLLNLDDPTRANSREGKLAERWQKKSGVPGKEEFAAMEIRSRAFKKAAPTATLLVYPARAGDEMSNESAENLATLITKAKLMKATAANSGPQIKVQREMNEQKTLWSMARAFRQEVRKQPQDADYVLFRGLSHGKKRGGRCAFRNLRSTGRVDHRGFSKQPLGRLQVC